MESAQIPCLKKKKPKPHTGGMPKTSFRRKHRPIRLLSPSVFQIVVDFLHFRVITVAINSLT